MEIEKPNELRGPNTEYWEGQDKMIWANYKPVVNLVDRNSLEMLGFSKEEIEEILKNQKGAE